jgi:predicted transcriptional regulator
MTKITFPIERGMRDQLAEIAKNERRSLAFIMREAATIFLDRVSDTPDKNTPKTKATKRKAA